MSKKDSDQAKPWGGRFTESTDAFVEEFTASVRFDQRLYRQDIAGSVAHARMLAGAGILTEDEARTIVDGLGAIRDDIEAGRFTWDVSREDVHMNIEAALIERIGNVGKKLHTARSRNDQVATDMRLFLRDEVDRIRDEITRLQAGITELAGRHAATVMPGFTHLQAAQPVTFGHHLMAWNEMLQRDYERLGDCRGRINVLPLGSAALAGTTYPIDREHTREQLGFDAISENSLDAVSDRDFAIEFCACAALVMVHLSRMAEELVLWTSQRFAFIELPDRFCTGSSIMPQKKNPDVPELVRGKSGRVIGHLVGLLTLMKGQPLAYNKDNQEDKEPLFDSVDTLFNCVRAFADMIPAIRPLEAPMRAAAGEGFTTATDLADYLVRQGVAFRDAHEVVGKAVRIAIDSGRQLHELGIEEFRALSPVIDDSVYELLTLDGSVRARDHLGGTAPDQVAAAVARSRERLAARSRKG